MNRESKVRGMRRKINQMTERVEEMTSTFPTTLINGYWNRKLPIGQRVLYSKRFKRRGKRAVVETLMDGAIHLKQIRPDESSRIVVLLDIPTHWSSEIIVFHSDDTYRYFMQNVDWVPIAKDDEQDTYLPTLPVDVELKRFTSTTCDEDGWSESEIRLLEI